jgi:hypothetical protein
MGWTSQQKPNPQTSTGNQTVGQVNHQQPSHRPLDEVPL